MSVSQFLTIQAIADRLGVHRSTVSRMLDDGVLPSIQVRGDKRVDLADFLQWIQQSKAASLKRAAQRREQQAPERRAVGRPRKRAVGS